MKSEKSTVVEGICSHQSGTEQRQVLDLIHPEPSASNLPDPFFVASCIELLVAFREGRYAEANWSGCCCPAQPSALAGQPLGQSRPVAPPVLLPPETALRRTHLASQCICSRAATSSAHLLESFYTAPARSSRRQTSITRWFWAHLQVRDPYACWCSCGARTGHTPASEFTSPARCWRKN